MLESFTIPAGFVSRSTAFGTLLVAPAMQIRCIARERPLRHPHAFLGAAPRAPERLITDEGELAVRCGDEERELGMVIGDDFAAVFIGATSDRAQQAALADVVDALTRACRLQLGVRRRRYLYQRPAGWQGFSIDGFDAHFLAPGHPRTPGCLTVHAAVPATATLDAWWNRSATLPGLASAFDAEPVIDEMLVGPGQLAGRRVRVHGRDGERQLLAELTCFADREYWYPIVLVCDDSAFASHAAVVNELAQSIQPLSRRPGASRSLAAMEHWFR